MSKNKTFDGTEVKNPNFKYLTMHENSKIFTNGNFIPMGSGLSYTPCFLGDDVNSLVMVNKKKIFLNKNKKLITVAANTKLFEVYNFLIKNNFFLEIQPGLQNATIGGCIANNVHGKNHLRDGNFINQVTSFVLKTHNDSLVYCSRNKNSELFYLTAGGLGLTGMILKANLRVKEIKSNCVEVRSKKINSLKDIPSLKNIASSNDFFYTWHRTDLKNFGKGIAFFGNLNEDKNSKYAVLKSISFYKNPFNICLYNKVSIFTLNLLYYFYNILFKVKNISLSDAIYPFTKNKFYFTLFASSGFYEYQVIIPHKNFSDYLIELENIYKKFRPVITLMSTKYFNSKKKYLYFSGKGICIALNLPKNKNSVLFLNELDNISIKYECIPNISKDSRLSLHIIKKTYGKNYYNFKNKIKKYNKSIFKSSLSKILDI